jgi:serine/threonine-protein phosphatase 2A regulatory subunit A
VRLAIIDHIPLLAEQLGETFFDEQLCELCMSWMGDDVHAVRLAATNNLRRLTQLFGGSWVNAHMLPKVTQMHNHSSYLNRMTALYAVQVRTN